MRQILVRYGEIALKGKNRSEFEKLLARNIQRAIGFSAGKVDRQYGQIVVSVWDKNIDEMLGKLGGVLGISWYAKVVSCGVSRSSILSSGLKFAERNIDVKDSFAVRASRSNKDLPFTSKEIENQLGDAIRKKTKAKVDLNNPDKTIFISLRRSESFIFSEKSRGFGGLPVGMSGKVLSLLSGGFDSIASSFLLAKRGAVVDFLHFHVFPRYSEVGKTKMSKIWNRLSRYTFSKQVYLASYIPFQMAVLNLKERDEKYELVVFRRLMARVGEIIADKNGYQALVFGDSLGQVASQTMENITAVDKGVSISILRPLIGYDKVETIDLVKQIGLASLATENYKDCCSLVSSHPATRAKLSKVNGIEKKLGIESVAQEIASSVEVLSLE